MKNSISRKVLLNPDQVFFVCFVLVCLFCGVLGGFCCCWLVDGFFCGFVWVFVWDKKVFLNGAPDSNLFRMCCKLMLISCLLPALVYHYFPYFHKLLYAVEYLYFFDCFPQEAIASVLQAGIQHTATHIYNVLALSVLFSWFQLFFPFFLFFVMSVRMKTGCKETNMWVKSQVPSRWIKHFISGTAEPSISKYSVRKHSSTISQLPIQFNGT